MQKIFAFLSDMDLFGNQFGNDVIRTLGLHQPYASLIWLDDKIETRWIKKGKKAPFPLGTYMIYATKKIYKLDEVYAISGPYLSKSLWINDMRYAITGVPLFIADLELVYDFDSSHKSTEIMQERTFVQYNISKTHRLVCLEFTNKRRIKSFPFKGKQGVGILTPEQKAQIEFI